MEPEQAKDILSENKREKRKTFSYFTEKIHTIFHEHDTKEAKLPPLSQESQQLGFLKARIKEGELDLSNGSGNIANLAMLDKAVGLDNIKTLYLQFNNRQNIIQAFGMCEMNNLTELNLSFNYISDLSALTLLKSQNLQIMSLNDNRIESIDPFVHMQFYRLTTLDLERNSIKQIDALVACDFQNLINLNLKINKIQDFFPLCRLKFGMKQGGQKPQQIELAKKRSSFYLIILIQHNPGTNMISRKMIQAAII